MNLIGDWLTLINTSFQISVIIVIHFVDPTDIMFMLCSNNNHTLFFEGAIIVVRTTHVQ